MLTDNQICFVAMAVTGLVLIPGIIWLMVDSHKTEKEIKALHEEDDIIEWDCGND